MPSSSVESRYRTWRWRIFGSTWLTYAGYYLTRKAFAAAKIELAQESVMGLSNEQLGYVDTAYLTAYMIGQFMNGPLADRLGPRRIVLIGIGVSVSACFLSGFATGLGMLVVFAIVQGMAQSTGWPSLVKNMSSWFSQRERGRIMGWWCTNYAIGGLVATPFAGAMIEGFGSWRFGFFLPSAALLLVGIVFFVFQRDRPESVGLPSIESFHGEAEAVLVAAETPEQEPEGSWKVIGEVVGKNRTIWFLAAAYFCLKPVRYAILFWGPKLISDELGTATGESVLLSAPFEIGGPLGILAAGYLSDRVFGSRRMPVCAIMLALVGVTLLLLDDIAGLGRGGVMVVLFFLGFFVFGPDSLLSGTAAMDFGTKKAAATAAGFVNGMGSLGAILGGALPGYISERWGWGPLFYTLSGFVFLAALLMVPLWNTLPPVSDKGAAA